MNRIERLHILVLLAGMPAWTAGVLAQTTRLATRPATEPATGLATGPTTKLTRSPATKPATSPATRPTTRTAKAASLPANKVLGPPDLYAAVARSRSLAAIPGRTQAARARDDVLGQLKGKRFAARGILGDVRDVRGALEVGGNRSDGRQERWHCILWVMGPAKRVCIRPGETPTKHVSMDNGAVRTWTTGEQRDAVFATYQASIRIECSTNDEQCLEWKLSQGVDVSGEIAGVESSWATPRATEKVGSDAEYPHIVVYLRKTEVKKVGP